MNKSSRIISGDADRTARSQGQTGFTLLEILISIAILATLSAIAIPNYIRYREKAQIVVAVAEIRIIEKSLAVYELDHDNLPESLADAGLGHMRDPWGNPYQYLKIQFVEIGGSGKGKGPDKSKVVGKVRKDRFLHPLNTDYDLYSMGIDGKSVAPLTAKQSRDDILRAANGSFVGLAADF